MVSESLQTFLEAEPERTTKLTIIVETYKRKRIKKCAMEENNESG